MLSVLQHLNAVDEHVFHTGGVLVWFHERRIILDRLRVWLFFGGGMVSLMIFAGLIYLGLKVATRAARGRKSS